MDKLIIGSTAIKYWFPDFKREPKDIDFISKDVFSSRSEENIWIPEFEAILKRNKDGKYIDPDLLLTLKESHFGWDIKWEKHRSDILFLRQKGLKPNKELYHILFNGWVRIHGKKWAKLKNKTADEFFNDAVKRKYVHDDIHEAIAIYDAPLYTRILESPYSVKCLESKFNLLSEVDKLLLVKEEVWVTALERYLIPSNFTFSPKFAYNKSLKKLVTTMSANGWFKHFLVDNYHKLADCNDTSYIQKFKLAESKGQLKYD